MGRLKAPKLDQRQVPDEVHQAPGCFESNLARMRYKQFRAQGYLIGSGTIESGCKNAVHLHISWTRLETRQHSSHAGWSQ